MVDLDRMITPRKSNGNKILVGLIIVLIILVTAAIIVLIILLNKPTDKCTTVGGSCNSDTVEPFYFTVASAAVNFSDVTNGSYMNAIQTLQKQIGDALTNGSGSGRSASVSNFDSSNILPVVILGISAAASGPGVSVIASTVFMGGNLPNPQDITNLLNTNGLTALQVINATESTQESMQTQMCERVFPNATNPGTPPPPTTTPQAPPTTSTASSAVVTTTFTSSTTCPTCTCASPAPPTQCPSPPPTPPPTQCPTPPPTQCPSPPPTPTTSVSSSTAATTTSTSAATTSTSAASCPNCTCPPPTTPPPTQCPSPPPTPPPTPCPTTTTTVTTLSSSTSAASPTTYTPTSSSLSTTPMTSTGSTLSSASSSSPITSTLMSSTVSTMTPGSTYSPSSSTATDTSSSVTSSSSTASSPTPTTSSTQSAQSSSTSATSSSSSITPSSSASSSSSQSSSVSSSQSISSSTAASSTSSQPMSSSSASMESSSSSLSSTSVSSTSPSSSTSTMPTTTCSPPTTQSPPYPCQANIIILLDATNGVNDEQFGQQQQFISNELFDNNWTFTELALGAYDDSDQQTFQQLSVHFGDILNLAEAQNLVAGANLLQNTASIATGLRTTLTVFEGQQPCVKQVTVVFASTSNPTDILASQHYAVQLQALGPLAFVAMGPNVNTTSLASLASPGAVVSWPDFSNTTGLAERILLASSCYSGSSTSSTSISSSSSATTATSSMPSTPTSSTASSASSSSPVITSSSMTPTSSSTTSSSSSSPAMSTASSSAMSSSSSSSASASSSTTPPSSSATSSSSSPTMSSSLSSSSPSPTSISSTSPATSTSTTPTTTCSPPTTQSPPYPCQANIIILLDATNGVNDEQFGQQQQFISNELFDNNWTFTELALGAYDDSDQQTFQQLSVHFGDILNLAEAQNLVAGANLLQNTASIATGLRTTLTVFEGQQPCVKQVTVVFASTSNPTDILASQHYAVQLQALGPLAFVAMGPNVNTTSLASLASPGAVVSWPDFSNTTGLADRILLASSCYSGSSTSSSSISSSSSATTASSASPTVSTASSSAASTSSSPTMSSSLSSSSPSPTSILSTSPATSTLTTPTTTCSPPPTQSIPYPCQANIIILLDSSNGTNEAQFKQQQLFISNELFDVTWTFAQLALGAYDDRNPNNFEGISLQFGTITTLTEAQGLVNSAHQYFDTASIATGLQKTLTVFEGQQPCTKQVTVIFASTSAPTDVNEAIPSARLLQALGPVIFVAMGPNANVFNLIPLATPGSIVSWPDFNNTTGVRDQILDAFNCFPSLQNEDVSRFDN